MAVPVEIDEKPMQEARRLTDEAEADKQACADHGVTLVHNDRGFERIATVILLKHLRLDLSA